MLDYSVQERKKKKNDQDGCNLELGQACELFSGGTHNCRKDQGLACALFCKKGKLGDCQYWCVKKVGETCAEHKDCLYEYCEDNTKTCMKRKEKNDFCKIDQECFSFKCDKENEKCQGADSNPCDKTIKKDDKVDPNKPDPNKPDPNNPDVGPDTDPKPNPVDPNPRPNPVDPDPDVDPDIIEPDNIDPIIPNPVNPNPTPKPGPNPEPPKLDDEYKNVNGLPGDEPTKLEPDNSDPYINPADAELFTSCDNDSQCNDKVKAVDGTMSTLACQDGKCRLKPGQYCYPGNDNLSYTCYNSNACRRRYIKRPFKKEQISDVYSQIKSITDNSQQVQLNQWEQKVSRVEQFGDFDILNKRIPQNGVSFYFTYQCVVKERYQCTDDKYCANYSCENQDSDEGNKKSFCVDKSDGKECEQHFECEQGNCQNKNDKNTCNRKYSDSDQCNYNYECESHTCRRYKPTFFVTEIHQLITKNCQKKNSLPLNAKCQEHRQCSSVEILDDGSSKTIAQLQCIESNIVNKQQDVETSINAVIYFFDNYKQTVKEVNEIHKMESFLTNDDLKTTLPNNYTFKCKIPNGSVCDSDHQCPYSHVCETGKCKAQENGFCVNDTYCAKGFKCSQIANKASPVYRRRICQDENATK